MAIVLFLLMFRIDNDTTVVDTFDVIEVNHHCGEWGYEKWTQLICWNWKRGDKKFHVEYWVMMKDAYSKTEEGEKEHEKRRREIESKIKSIELKRDFLRESEYMGDFVGGKLFPRKDWKNNIYVIQYIDRNVRRKIQAKIFRETWTQHDPEQRDRKEYPQNLRSGITKESQSEINLRNLLEGGIEE